jgi:hypothetical protein
MPTEEELCGVSMWAQGFSATGLQLFGSSQTHVQKTVVVLGVATVGGQGSSINSEDGRVTHNTTHTVYKALSRVQTWTQRVRKLIRKILQNLVPVAGANERL